MNQREEIIIEPVREQTSEETEGSIKKNVNIMELGVGVSGIAKRTKGKVILERQKSSDRNLLVGAIKESLGTQYKVFAPEKRLPLLKIAGIEEEVERKEEENFIKRVRKQNEMEEQKENFKMKIIKKSTLKGSKTILIVEVDPETHKYFVERARMKVGWKNCPVYDHVNVTRCYKCWGFNHFAKEYRNESSYRKCGGGHEARECTSEKKSCVNCCRMVTKFKLDGIATEHEATDINCESYKRIVNRNRRNIQE